MKNSDASNFPSQKFALGRRCEKMKKRVLVNPLLSMLDAFVNG